MLRLFFYLFSLQLLAFTANAEDSYEENRSKIVQEVGELAAKCKNSAFNKAAESTREMMLQSEEANDCLEIVLKTEIKKLFRPAEASQELERLKTIKTAVLEFSWTAHNDNKYCPCGTITQPENLLDWNDVLQTLLINIKMINIGKGE